MFYEFQIYKFGNKKNVFRKDVLEWVFIFILKIFFPYETIIPETPKIIKGNFDIFEKSRGL